MTEDLQGDQEADLIADHVTDDIIEDNPVLGLVDHGDPEIGLEVGPDQGQWRDRGIENLATIRKINLILRLESRMSPEQTVAKKLEAVVAVTEVKKLKTVTAAKMVVHPRCPKCTQNTQRSITRN